MATVNLMQLPQGDPWVTWDGTNFTEIQESISFGAAVDNGDGTLSVNVLNAAPVTANVGDYVSHVGQVVAPAGLAAAGLQEVPDGAQFVLEVPSP